MQNAKEIHIIWKRTQSKAKEAKVLFLLSVSTRVTEMTHLRHSLFSTVVSANLRKFQFLRLLVSSSSTDREHNCLVNQFNSKHGKEAKCKEGS
jgi:hypothetical protein